VLARMADVQEEPVGRAHPTKTGEIKAKWRSCLQPGRVGTAHRLSPQATKEVVGDAHPTKTPRNYRKSKPNGIHANKFRSKNL
jgi:hypothetical protein